MFPEAESRTPNVRRTGRTTGRSPAEGRTAERNHGGSPRRPDGLAPTAQAWELAGRAGPALSPVDGSAPDPRGNGLRQCIEPFRGAPADNPPGRPRRGAPGEFESGGERIRARPAARRPFRATSAAENIGPNIAVSIDRGGSLRPARFPRPSQQSQPSMRRSAARPRRPAAPVRLRRPAAPDGRRRGSRTAARWAWISASFGFSTHTPRRCARATTRPLPARPSGAAMPIHRPDLGTLGFLLPGRPGARNRHGDRWTGNRPGRPRQSS